MARTRSAAAKHRIVKRQIIAGHSANRKAFLEAAAYCDAIQRPGQRHCGCGHELFSRCSQRR